MCDRKSVSSLTASRVIGTLLCVAVMLVGSAEASAEDGTHFLAEAEFGTSLPMGIETANAGWAIGATGGVGGKIPGSTLRVYGIGEFAYSSFSVLRDPASLGLERNTTELSMGARFLVPLLPWLRVFADGLIGIVWLESEELGPKGEQSFIVEVDPRWSLFAAIGVQFRPAEFLSFGVSSNFGWIVDDEGLPANDASGRVNLMGTATLHF